MHLFKKILYNILSIQEKILRYRLSRTLGVKNSSNKKIIYQDGCTINLSTLAETERQKLENEISFLIKKYNYNPEEILNYIKQSGTRVTIIENAASILNPIGENEGFIYPANGAKALYLSLATDKTIKFRTPEMFILSKGEINKYYFIYQFYNWFAYKHNIAGLDTESQKLLKKYLFETTETNSLQLEEIYRLKDAIHQDKAAIEFVIKLCRNFDGAKQALNKMKEHGSANL